MYPIAVLCDLILYCNDPAPIATLLLLSPLLIFSEFHPIAILPSPVVLDCNAPGPIAIL